MNNDKRKRYVVIFDLLSLTFGICGVTFGFLSLFALCDFWTKNTYTQQFNSLIFTGVTLGVDIVSCLCAGVSFKFGKTIYKSLDQKETDPIKQRLFVHEKRSYRFDETSFIIGLFGLCCGLTSLLTIIPWKGGGVGSVNSTLSEVSLIVTGPAILSDILSSLMIVFALSEYAKYNELKHISSLVRESASSGRTRRW